MPSTADVSEIFDSVVASCATGSRMDETLLLVTQAACDNLAGVDFASISIRYDDGSLATAGATDPRIILADQWQYELRQGPCYSAATYDAEFVSPDVGSDDRWPAYGAHAERLGLHAQAAFPLYRHEGSRAALNLFSSTTDAFEDPEHLLGLFTRHASLALGYAGATEDIEHAHAAIAHKAIEVLVQRYIVDEDRALEYLIRVSQAGGLKLKDVADEVVQLSREPNSSRELPLRSDN